MNALRQLGFDTWLATDAAGAERAPQLGLRILDALARRAALPASDAMRSALRSERASAPRPAARTPVPGRRRRLARALARRLWVHARHDHGLRAAVRRWSRAVARQCEASGLSLAAVVRRPARLTWTRTHVDVAFDLAAADVTIRLAGLDLDPGWVGWLGRVVSFHYLEASP
jgi:hypothetical protein